MKFLQTRDYFLQFLDSRGLNAESFLELDGDGTVPYVSGTDEVCRMFHDLPKDTAIGLLTDFDFDGCASSLIGYLGFSLMGFTNVRVLPRHAANGYDPDETCIDFLGACSVLVTADVGTSAVRAVSYARQSYGMTVVVTDHHLGGAHGDTSGIADYFVNPMFDSGEPICGAMVLWTVFSRYFSLYPDVSVMGDLKILRHFAGMATLADSMPLVGFNRRAVREMLSFLSYINPPVESCVVGFTATHPLVANVVWNLHRFVDRFFQVDPYDPDAGFRRGSVDQDFVEYKLIPAVNSIKRMDGCTDLFLRCFFGSDSDSAQAQCALMELNESRKNLVSRLYGDILDRMESGQEAHRHVFVLPSGNPAGICGLVAQKLSEALTGPCAVFLPMEDGSFSGSARAPFGYPFLTLVNASGFASCAGHNPACGCTTASGAQMELLEDFLEDSFSKWMQSQVRPDASGGFDILMDVCADFYSFHRRVRHLLSDLKKAGPFGSGFPRAQVLLKVPVRDVLCSGFGLSGTAHTRVNLGNGVRCLLWNQTVADVADRVRDGSLYLAGTCSRSFTPDGPGVDFSCTALDLSDPSCASVPVRFSDPSLYTSTSMYLFGEDDENFAAGF